MNQLAIISHPDFGNVRVVAMGGEFVFVAKDVCEILNISKYRDVFARLDDDEKGCPVIVDTLGGKQSMATVKESGLYALIFLSNKPKAKLFRKWVTSEVLPSIRKFGFYIHPSAQLSSNQLKVLNRVMRESTRRYLVNADIHRCAKRLGVSAWYVECVLAGREENNDVMLDLQQRALANQEKWENAYDPARMMEVVNNLTVKK